MGETDSVERRPWWTDYWAHPTFGPLPALLLVLTVSTGLVDAVSILSLGRVFVANMTGNIVFIGFALAGAPGFSLQASVVALAAFLVGAGVGGVFVARWASGRMTLFRATIAVEVVLLVGAAVVVTVLDAGTARDDLAVAFAGVALGLQNAAVRSLAVPDLTTTVLTMTLTGIAADLRKRDFRVATRRLAAVAAMLGGAVLGAVLIREWSASVALWTDCGVVAAVLLGCVFAAQTPTPETD